MKKSSVDSKNIDNLNFLERNIDDPLKLNYDNDD